MNDFMEVEWFKSGVCGKVMEQQYDKITRSTPSVSSMSHSALSVVSSPPHSSSSSSSSPPSASAPHRFWSALQKHISTRVADHIYCGCFSALSDDLSQWRGYADDARGVSIGFDLRQILDAPQQPLPLRHLHIDYDDERAATTAKEIILSHAENVGSGDGIIRALDEAATAFHDLRDAAPGFKNPQFRAEREIRIVVADTSVFPGHDNDSLPHATGPIRFHVRNGNLVPYIEVVVPPEAIKEIWIGPGFGDDLRKGALTWFLTSNGITPPIRRSAATYRPSIV